MKIARTIKSFSLVAVTTLVLSPVFCSCSADKGNDSAESEAQESELVEQIDETMTTQAEEEQDGEVAGDMITEESAAE